MVTSNLVPHSFVLADVFEVQSMTLEIPDHVYENDSGLEWVACPECEGEGWIGCYGLSPYSASAKAWHRPDLNLVYKPCLRCNQQGEVLDAPPAVPNSFDSDLEVYPLAA